MKGHFAAIALIVIGALAPGVNLERFEFDFARLARTGGEFTAVQCRQYGAAC